MHHQDASGIVQEIFTRSREHGCTGFPSKQLTVETDFEPLDLMADGRLRQAQRDGCFCYASVLPDCGERPQRIDFQSATVQLVHGPIHLGLQVTLA